MENQLFIGIEENCYQFNIRRSCEDREQNSMHWKLKIITFFVQNVKELNSIG